VAVAGESVDTLVSRRVGRAAVLLACLAIVVPVVGLFGASLTPQGYDGIDELSRLILQRITICIVAAFVALALALASVVCAAIAVRGGRRHVVTLVIGAIEAIGLGVGVAYLFVGYATVSASLPT